MPGRLCERAFEAGSGTGDGVRVLGIDPGLTRCGVGVVDGSVGRRLDMVAAGAIRTSADAELPERLLGIERGVEEWLDEHRPDAVAVERVFAQHNVSTVMGTAQASAIAITCAARRGLPVALHTPSEVKAAITGNGRADKVQVGTMVARLLHLEGPPKPADAADAVALAICHIWRGGAQARVARAQQDFARKVELTRRTRGL
ncbi:crossover junction endodeoxyribonuclease RuvC [Spinactinospora alkalitolerans]|uniref:Crossover junction endodeoxyribonuclease RuvC n=1 Tax=Spinactinospora alkalitolerans TaxID=687207 RepID=A0A852TTA2_9ACTN|nr:crossover junction endodeoxyribonuclease RuvC [Spinactinospora alkalitolerans]